MKKERCSCCGNKTIIDKGHYDICDVCGWQDDPIQNDNEYYEGGANEMSLKQAKKAYKEGKKIK